MEGCISAIKVREMAECKDDLINVETKMNMPVHNNSDSLNLNSCNSFLATLGVKQIGFSLRYHYTTPQPLSPLAVSS